MQYKNLQKEKLEIRKFNIDYEEYNKDNLNGLDITTVINRAVSNNEKYFVEKDDEGLYDTKDENCIVIYLKLASDSGTVRMERLSKAGDLNSFIELFGEVGFKCTGIKYHKNGRVSLMIFEAKEY